MFDVIIVGGGASGLACGIEAARRGKRCLILEQKEKPGKKLYATGNGKCNFANRNVEPDAFRTTGDPELLSKIVTRELCRQAEEFFREMGILSVERQGCLYPRSEQAASLVRAMEQVFIKENGTILCNEQVEDATWDAFGTVVTVSTKENHYRGKKLVLAAGGMASPGLGSNGSGYTLAKAMGHTITHCVPALCGLKCREQGWNRLQGVRAKGRVSLCQDRSFLAEDSGEIQFTQYGVSGIVIFNLSRYAGFGLSAKHKITLTMDFFPDFSARHLRHTLQQMQADCGYRGIQDILSGFLPEKLAVFLIERARIPGRLSCDSLTSEQLWTLVQICKATTIQITGVNSFDQAQVTAGGIPLKEIDPATMESKQQPGCYLIGELLDVDGICGGYNLMWAWETGRRAGRAI